MSLEAVLLRCLPHQSIDLPTKNAKPTDPSDHVLTLTAPVRLKRVGREMKLLVDDSNDDAAPDMSLLRIIARAHDVQARLAQNTKLTVHDIARDGTSHGRLHLYPAAPSLARA